MIVQCKSICGQPRIGIVIHEIGERYVVLILAPKPADQHEIPEIDADIYNRLYAYPRKSATVELDMHQQQKLLGYSRIESPEAIAKYRTEWAEVLLSKVYRGRKKDPWQAETCPDVWAEALHIMLAVFQAGSAFHREMQACEDLLDSIDADGTKAYRYIRKLWLPRVGCVPHDTLLRPVVVFPKRATPFLQKKQAGRMIKRARRHEQKLFILDEITLRKRILSS